jgi:hypothetical protein
LTRAQDSGFGGGALGGSARGRLFRRGQLVSASALCTDRILHFGICLLGCGGGGLRLVAGLLRGLLERFGQAPRLARMGLPFLARFPEPGDDLARVAARELISQSQAEPLFKSTATTGLRAHDGMELLSVMFCPTPDSSANVPAHC